MWMRVGQDKAYGRAALEPGEADTEVVLGRFRAVEAMIGDILGGVNVTPSLLHGDLWIGEAIFVLAALLFFFFVLCYLPADGAVAPKGAFAIFSWGGNLSAPLCFLFRHRCCRDPVLPPGRNDPLA